MGSPCAVKSLPALVEQFCNDLWISHGLAENTVSAYRSDLISFSTWLSQHNGKTLLQVIFQDIDDWLLSLLERKIGASSVARYKSSLRRFYQFIALNGLISQDPTASLSKMKVPQRLPNTPTQEEIESLLAVTELNSHPGLRDKATKRRCERSPPCLSRPGLR